MPRTLINCPYFRRAFSWSVPIGGLAGLVAARLAKAKTKTWVTTSGNPRASHAAMDGETVELNQAFSNGSNGPGDYSAGADEVAGCTCDLSFSTEG